jgi:hypothetical protein
MNPVEFELTEEDRIAIRAAIAEVKPDASRDLTPAPPDSLCPVRG